MIVRGAVVPVTWFLIFAVADTTLLTWRVIKGFRMKTGILPPKTLKQFSHRLKLPLDVLDDWIDLVFVSKRTKCITTLIYYPFLIIALLVVSRSRLFANYGTSVPILVSMGTSILIVTVCAVALRWSAEASRAKARQRLIDLIVAAKRSTTGGRRGARPVDRVLDRRGGLREARVAPALAQPGQQHRRRADQRRRIGAVLPRDVGRRAVLRLRHGVDLAGIERGREPEAAADLG